MPSDVIADLGLPWIQMANVVLSDGSTCECDIYRGIIVWDRRPIKILVEVADTTPLVGMGLLRGFKLTMNVERRGRVTITRLRRGRE